MGISKQSCNSQSTTLGAGVTTEQTIVSADPNFPNALIGLIITTPNVAAATLTLRDATAGTVRAIIDYPNSGAAPSVPLILPFDPPLTQAKNSNWTLQASGNVTAIHVLAMFAAL